MEKLRSPIASPQRSKHRLKNHTKTHSEILWDIDIHWPLIHLKKTLLLQNSFKNIIVALIPGLPSLRHRSLDQLISYDGSLTLYGSRVRCSIVSTTLLATFGVLAKSKANIAKCKYWTYDHIWKHKTRYGKASSQPTTPSVQTLDPHATSSVPFVLVPGSGSQGCSNDSAREMSWWQWSALLPACQCLQCQCML